MSHKFIIFFTIMLFVSCNNTDENNNISGVQIPQTKIKSQGVIGFCWSYTIVGMIESEYLKRNRKEINLSEEYIGMLNMIERANETLNQAKNLGIEPMDFWGLFDQSIVSIPEGQFVENGLKLLKKYGLVLESKWSVKFDNSEELHEMTSKMKNRLIALFQKIRLENRNTNITEIYENVFMKSFNLPELPKKNGTLDFTENLEFMVDFVKFDPNNYKEHWITSVNELDEGLIKVKKALQKGYSVPLTVGIDYRRLKGTTFGNLESGGTEKKPEDSLSLADGSQFVPKDTGQFRMHGAHAMVITDFANNDSSEGKLPDNLLDSAVEATPSETLNYFKLKNSWGTDSQNEFGRYIKGSGYYTINYSYLKDSIEDYPLGILLPK